MRTTRRAVTVEAENAWDARKLAERKMNKDEFAPNEIQVVDAYLADSGGSRPLYSGIMPPPCNGMMPPPDSEMIAPPITE